MTSTTRDIADDIAVGLAAGLLIVGLAGAILLIALLLGFVWAAVLADLWAWFAVPALHAPPLTLVNAYGLILIATVFTHGLKRVGADDDGDKKPGQKLVGKIVGPLLTAGTIWLVGALVHRFGAPWPFHG